MEASRPNEWKAYTLPRDVQESGRLNTQHEVYRTCTGYLLHPRIVQQLPHDARVAEVGTGTGIWLRDLAAHSPASWTYTGLDLSASQFPAASAAVDRVTFAQLDVLQPIPDEYKGRFDVVHLRLLICGLSGADWDVAAKHVLTMLKPGGWVQWHEGNFAGMQAYSNAPGASTVHCTRLLQLLLDTQRKYGRMGDDVIRLRRIVARAGFESCAEDLFSSDRVADTRAVGTQVVLGAYYAMCKLASVQDAEFGLSPSQVDELNERCQDEVGESKAYCRWNMHIVTAQRPVG